MSTELTDRFDKEQYLNSIDTVIRMETHSSLSEYQKHLKISIGDINIEDCGELKEEDFYDIMAKVAPFIAQRILERKANKNENSIENEEVIDYFKTTENYFENQNRNKTIFKNCFQKETIEEKPKIYQFFQEINNNKEIKIMDKTRLSEYINEVRDKTKSIIEFNKIKFDDGNESKGCENSLNDFCQIF